MSNNEIPYLAIGNNEPIPENLPEELKTIIRQGRTEAGFDDDGNRIESGSRPQSSKADTNDELLTALQLDSRAWITHWLPELNPAQTEMLIRYMKQLRVREIEDYADFLSDQEEEAAFELAWQEYAYKQTRAIDAE